MDGDVGSFAGAFVFGRNVQDTVGVNVEGYFDLRHTAWCRCNVGQVELTQRLVGRSAFAFALQHMDSYSALVVFGSREHLRRFSRNSSVLLNQLGHHAAHGFDTQGQRGYVQQQYVAAAAAQYFALNRCAYGNGFVRVHVFTRLFAEEVSNGFLYFRHTALTADQNYVVDVAGAQAGIFQCDFARLDRTLDQIFNQAFEFGTGNFHSQVFRTGCVHSNVRQVDFGLLTAGQFDFGFLGSFFQALQSHDVLFQINALFFFELVNDVVDQALVEVFTAQEGVAVGCQYFELFVAVDVGDFDDGNIESTATQVIHGDFTVFAVAFVHTECQSGRGRFVDDAFYFQTRDTSCVFSRLTLAVVEVGRNGNHGFGYFFAQVSFGRFFHFTQNFCGNLRRRQLFALCFHPCVAVVGFDDFKRHGLDVALYFFVFKFVADQTFGRVNSVFSVGYRLAFCWRADENFAAVQISDNGRSGACAFCVFDYFSLTVFRNGQTRVGCT